MNEIALDLNVSVIPNEIKYDLNPIRSMIKSVDGLYKDWLVKKEDLPTAKSTITQLNKISKTLSAKRIEVAKNFKKPLDDFENEIKELCKVLDERSSSIKIQTDKFEAAIDEETRKSIMSLPQYKPFIKFDERWFNKGITMPTILAAIEAQTSQHEKSCQAIEAVCERNNMDSKRYLEELNAGTSFDSISEEIAHDYSFLKSVGAPLFKPNFKDQELKKASPELTAFGAKIDETVGTISIKVVGMRYQLDALKRIAREELNLTVIE